MHFWGPYLHEGNQAKRQQNPVGPNRLSKKLLRTLFLSVAVTQLKHNRSSKSTTGPRVDNHSNGHSCKHAENSQLVLM